MATALAGMVVDRLGLYLGGGVVLFAVLKLTGRPSCLIAPRKTLLIRLVHRCGGLVCAGSVVAVWLDGEPAKDGNEYHAYACNRNVERLRFPDPFRDFPVGLCSIIICKIHALNHA